MSADERGGSDRRNPVYVGGPVARPALLVDEVSARLRDDIISGRLPPGTRISVASLSRELGVSQIPLRESIRRLEAEHLLETIPHSGSVVVEANVEEIGDIFGLRRLIEVDMVRRAAVVYQPADVQAISDTLRALEAEDPADPFGRFWTMHSQFHLAVVRPAMTPWTDRILRLLWQSTQRYRHIAGKLLGAGEETTEAQHAAIARAAQQGDLETLVTVSTEHLTYAESLFRDCYLAAQPPGEGA